MQLIQSMEQGARNGIFSTTGKSKGTGLAFVNSGEKRAIVVLTAYNVLGQAIGVETVVVEAGEKVLDLAEWVFDGDISQAVYITYVSDANLIGFKVEGEIVHKLMGDAAPRMAQIG